jgi:UDP-glucose-4-epimerase GalE
MAILVTGGLGFVGSHFVWAAALEGQRVVVLDDGSAGRPAPLPAEVTVERGDIADAPQLRLLLERHRVDGVVHFAGLIQVGESVRQPARYMDVNVIRSLRLLEVLREVGVARVVFSSTAAVYGNPERVPIPEGAPKSPVNPYGATKLAFEHALEAYGNAYGLRWAALRYFNASGAHPDGHLRESHDPETHLLPLVIDAALGRRPALTVFGTDYPTLDGTCVRDYIHVSDLAEAHLRALAVLASGRTLGALNLGTGSGYSVREVLGVAREVIGVDVPHSFGARRDGDPPSLVADASAARAILSWQPARGDLRVILEDALRSRR